MNDRQPTAVFLQGIFGPPQSGPIPYFRGLHAWLRAREIRAVFPGVPNGAAIAERAAAAAAQILALPDPAFVLLCHSMGGLDGRYLAAHLDPDKRVRGIVTVATPHGGTPVAARLLESHSLRAALVRRLGKRGLIDLLPEVRRREVIPDRDDIARLSYAGRCSVEQAPIFLRRYAQLIEGENDGLVPVASARWGEWRGILPCDHMGLVGWGDRWPSFGARGGFNHLAFWGALARDH